MLLRHATPDDVPLICSLEQQAETAAHWTEREYAALFASDAPPRMALIAADDAGTELRGFAIVLCLPDEWEIENVVVAPQHRRRGLATALVRKILHEAWRSNITSVLLEVRESNRAARQLYEKLGFSEFGRRLGYYQDPSEDALRLRASIAFA